MSAPLKVKAIWLKEGVEEGLKEVRRFRVSDESSGGGNGSQRLPNVLHNVHSLFNVHTATQYCTLYWKDEDDDLIQFSSEEELSHAIDSMSDDTLRIYVIITGEGPSAPSYEGKCADSNHPPQDTSSFSFSSSSSSSSSFQAPPPPPPPPPPPHQGPHSHCPPPPFPGPWAHQGWKKWKPMGPGGWKGGWKGGMYFGCPWTMRHGMAGCGHKGRGFFKHGCDKKQKKWMKAKRCWMAGSPNDQKEYEELLQQVPSEFRSWVGQYLQTWYTQGPEAARAAAPEKLPQNVGEDFPQWLHSYLTPFFPHPCVWGEGQAKEGEGEMGKAPSCIPSVYFRWLSGYVRSFFQQNGHFSFSSSSDGEEDDGSWQWQFQSHGFCPRGFGWKGKHGGCKKMKGGKHKRRMSCGSDDDGSGNCGVKVPKQFRKFVRVSFKKLRKGKAENPKIKAKATRAGISAEVQEYVEQIMLEWQAKLSLRNFRAVSKEMITSDRTLPPGMPRAHFLWMLRFMLHWEERRAGKRGAAHGCPSDDSSSEDTSEEESAPEEQDCGSCPPPPPPPPFHPPFMGMMGAGPVPFPIPMPSGMEHPFPPPPPPPMYGCFPPPPPPGCFPMNPPPYMFTCQDQDTENKKAPSSEEMVDQVTEGVKKL